ncbi:hypothetical protein [Planomicrobium okeanokoites]|uniref:Uncharacterized protein n=1 Tax=Planomicrobium okeanokoites TaxID=244 RepID=A0ABV7KTX7_PLAOK|nr:hypothetical protein [Planomicrobium okeanokoites]TAA67442.1 hypothetical protein D2910_13710 [Planomicrobium okeanokoites]
MNKRQRKKLDKKLTLAIRQLNDDVALDAGFGFITDEEVQEALVRVKKSKSSINQTLKDHKELNRLIY